MPERIKSLTSVPTELFSRKEPRLASIYLSTHRHSPKNDQDKIRFKNLVTEAEKQLQAGGTKRDYAKLIENLDTVLTDLDRQVWRHAEDGLAVFASEDDVCVRKLGYPVDDIAVVSDRFYVKPLIRDFQYGCHCYLLALSKDRFEIYRADNCVLDKLDMPEGVGSKLEDVFDDFDNRSSVNAGSYGGLDPLFHGHGSKSEIVEKETAKFFRYVNDVFIEHFSRTNDYPVILVGLPQHQADFRAIATIPGLIEQGIEKPPAALQETDLQATACSILKELRDSSIAKVLDMYGLYQSRDLASSDPSEIAHALVQRKVAILFIDENAVVPGLMNEDTGSISRETSGQWDGDLADQFVRLTFAGGGEVYSVTKDLMPSDTGVAAILRA